MADLTSLSARRAWIEIAAGQATSLLCWSLSARRAWIEMPNLKKLSIMASVALRKESVDRNGYVGVLVVLWALSLSARRAWIEI